MRREVLRLQLFFHDSLPGAAPLEFISIAPVPVQREQCQSNVSVVPVHDLTVSEEFVSPTPIVLLNVRSAEAVSEEIASAVLTSENAGLDVCPLPRRSRLF